MLTVPHRPRTAQAQAWCSGLYYSGLLSSHWTHPALSMFDSSMPLVRAGDHHVQVKGHSVAWELSVTGNDPLDPPPPLCFDAFVLC